MELVSIIINSSLSLIAIVISILTIIKQTNEQKVQNTIQLYDRRINVFSYFMDIYTFSGYLAGYYGFDKDKPFNEVYEKVKFAIENKKLDDEIYQKIINMRYEADKMRYLTQTLFEKELSDFICKLILDFSNYVLVLELVLDKKREFTKNNYNTFRNLYVTVRSGIVDGFNEKINKYISLVDIKRD